MTDTLAQLLDGAHAAAPNDRIRFRDPLAKLGRPALDAVLPWLTDPRLCHFAVRVIWKVGELGDRDRAVAALREALADPTVAVGSDDLVFHLRELGAAPPARPASKRDRFAVDAIPSRAGKGWPGFAEQEFVTTDGTFWRSRTGEASLIPHLVRPLRHVHPRFESWSIYHSPEVHIAVKDRYSAPGDWAQGLRAAKLVVYAHGYTPERPDAPHKVTCGLYIEKGDGTGDAGAVDDRWDWPYWLKALADPETSDRIEQTMARHDLQLGDYVGGNRFYPGGANVGFVGSIEDGRLVLRADGKDLGQGMSALRDRLASLPPNMWHDLHLWRSWPADEAIAAGPSFAGDSIVPVLTDLADVYRRFVPGVRSG